MIVEIWKDISGYEGLYQVSNFGRVRSIDRVLHIVRNGTKQTSVRKGCILFQEKTSDGYRKVRVNRFNKAKNFLVHVLVTKAFIDNSFAYPEFEVNHKDTNKENNCVTNLEIVTKSQNIKHAYDNNLFPSRKGDSNQFAKINYQIAERIRSDYQTGKYSMRELANTFGLKSETSICNIVNNRQWVK